MSSRVVMVADSQLVLEMSEQNFSGRPKRGPAWRCSFHRLQAAAGAHLRIPLGAWSLVAVDGPLGAGAVGDEHQVVLREDDALLHAIDPALDGGGRLSAVPDVEDHVGDLGAEAEVHPGLLQVLLHGQDQGLILVVPGELQGTEVGEPRDVVG